MQGVLVAGVPGTHLLSFADGGALHFGNGPGFLLLQALVDRQDGLVPSPVTPFLPPKRFLFPNAYLPFWLHNHYPDYSIGRSAPNSSCVVHLVQILDFYLRKDPIHMVDGANRSCYKALAPKRVRNTRQHTGNVTYTATMVKTCQQNEARNLTNINSNSSGMRIHILF